MFDYEGSRTEFLRFLAEAGEEPAFIARARAHETALTSLLARCEKERDERLLWPRRKFSDLRLRVAGDWSRLGALINPADAELLFSALSDTLSPADTQSSTSFFSTDRSILKAFLESATRFNSAWDRFLDSDLLDEVNQRRAEYNQHYPMEKACALGNECSSSDFILLPILGRDFLESRFPLLDLPIQR